MADLVTEWFMEPSVRTNYRTMVYYKGDGKDTFEINFEGGFIYKEDVKAFSVKDDTRERKNHKVTFVNGSVSRVKLDSAIPKGWTVCIYRDTPKAKPLAQFTDGAIINEANLDRNAQQAMFAVSEMVDRFDSTVESVEAALQQVYEANKKADQAINTANGAKATADSAVRIANGAVTTANEAKQSAANANATANGAVKTANEAKSIAQGLDGQIKQANTTANNAVTKADSAIKTANEAKATANGIDAKATKALNDSAQALKVANGIDGKATQALNNSKEALDKANAALQSQGIAKELTDRVVGYPTSLDVRWKGNHVFQQGITFDKTYDDSGVRGLVELWNEKELRFGARVSGKWNVARFDVNTGEMYLPTGTVYRSNSLDPIFRSAVRVERPDGYYARFRLQNGNNGDRVDILHDSSNKPQIISTKGSNGSTAYTWSFPSASGTLANENFVNDKVQYAEGNTRTWVKAPLKARILAIGNDGLMSLWNDVAKKRYFGVDGNGNIQGYGNLDIPGTGTAGLWRASRGGNTFGIYVRENGEGFLSSYRNGGWVGELSHPGKGGTIAVAQDHYKKSEVYTKSESDGRYMRKGEAPSDIKFTGIRNINPNSVTQHEQRPGFSLSYFNKEDLYGRLVRFTYWDKEPIGSGQQIGSSGWAPYFGDGTIRYNQRGTHTRVQVAY